MLSTSQDCYKWKINLENFIFVNFNINTIYILKTYVRL
jgi:hypothetical protein